MKIKVIIGSGYGDEGKGNLTDYFCEGADNPLVLRFNGGPQAAHTVVRDNKRHVFSSFGSGTLQNVPTVFRGGTLISPTLILDELYTLSDIGCKPELYYHPSCKIITPGDTLWNRYLEQKRGDGRHGSCGVGINATLQRSEFVPFIGTELYSQPLLDRIRHHYVRLFLEEEQSDLRDHYVKLMCDEALWSEFRLDCKRILNNSHVNMWTLGDEDNYDTLIFEGAQGLLLDEQYGDMPYCTPSNCGLQNIPNMLRGVDTKKCDVEVIYVSRCYTTRHGAGPLKGECTPEELGLVSGDKTNIPNEWQEHLRYAPLDMHRMLEVIQRDRKYLLGRMDFKTSVAFTCLDQLKDPNSMIKDLSDKFIDFDSIYYSFGPSAKDITKARKVFTIE